MSMSYLFRGSTVFAVLKLNKWNSSIEFDFPSAWLMLIPGYVHPRHIAVFSNKYTHVASLKCTPCCVFDAIISMEPVFVIFTGYIGSTRTRLRQARDSASEKQI